jgi:hypothetical protein
MSHRLQSPIKLDELSNYTERVVGQKSESYRDGSMGMVGNLKELYAGSLYKVKMKQANTFTSDRIFCDSHMPINLQPGWNWVGYPVEGCQTIGDALSGYLAEDGDKIVAQDGFSTFYNGKWTGTLSSFETGKGYMMYTSQAKTFSFGTPAMAINVRRIFKSNLITAKHGVDKYAYPNVMGIVASLCKGEETVLPHQLSLLAYVDGECRGVGQWIDGKIYLTVYGIGGETLEFFAWDENSDTCYTISEHMKFSSGVYGSMASPYVFYIGAADATSIEQVNKDENMPVREIEGYYNLMGTRVSDKSAPMVSGMYIVKYLKGGTRKVYIK